jgi:hypothetical protein
MSHVRDGFESDMGMELCKVADRASRNEYAVRLLVEAIGGTHDDADAILKLARTGNDFEELMDYAKALVFFKRG